MTTKLFKSLAATTVLAAAVVPVTASASELTIKEDVNYTFTTGSGQDTYFSTWVTNVDLATDEAGNKFAQITFAGHSYAIAGFKINGEAATIVSSTGSVETKDLVRIVSLPLDQNGQGVVALDGGERGSYNFEFTVETKAPVVELQAGEDVDFEFTTGSGQDAYFSAWVPKADIVVDENGQKVAHITFAGHSYAIAGFKVNGEAATIVSSTGSAETKDLQRVVALPLDEKNQGAVELDGGERGSYTFQFDFTPKAAEPTFEETLTDAFQKVEWTVTGMPAQFIIPTGIKHVQAKKTDDGIELLVKTQDGKTERGHIGTLTFKKGDEVLATASATSGDVAHFTVESIEGLTIEALYVDALGKETVYKAPVTEAVVVAEEKPEFDEVSPENFVDGSDLDESVFGTEEQKVKFTYDSLVSNIPSATAFGVMLPEATVQKIGEEYAVTLHMKPQRTEQVIVAQHGATVAQSAVDGTAPMDLQFTVSSLDDLFFYVDGVSGSGIETLIGVKVTGFKLLATEPGEEIEEPTEGVEDSAQFTDVTEFAEEIAALTTAGIVKGAGKGEYKPNANISRAEFAVMIARALGIQSTSDTAFADVKGEWFEKEVQALKEAGIINGFTETTFAPNEAVTREQAATMIVKALQHEGYKSTATAEQLNFKDADKVSAYAKHALAELQAADIMIGYEGVIDPAGNLTRGHMAKVLKRSLDLVNYEF